MKEIRFARELRYRGDKVVVPVLLLNARVPTRVDMVLDTGAGLSLLNRMFARQLGLTISAGAPMRLRAASGDETQGYVHPVDIEVLGRRMIVQVAFCPDWDSQNLLGMRGFFDQVVIAFDHANKRVYV